MSFTIASVSPSQVLSDGGHEIVIVGAYEAGHRYRVHLGDLGSTGDPACYSGIPGQGNIVYPKASVLGGSLDTLTVYSPRVNSSDSAYSITVMDYDTAEAHILSSSVTAEKNQYFTTVYAMKHVQNPKYYLGARDIELEVPAEEEVSGLDSIIEDISYSDIVDDETGYYIVEG